jgi:hypothetical protein
MRKSIEITLDGSAEELADLFSFPAASPDAQLTTLEDFIAHAFNQTLVRDQFYGGWAEVEQSGGQYVLKMYCAHHDLSTYERLIPAFLEAGKIAYAIYQENAGKIPQTGHDQMRFVLPLGLAMAKTRSVQLLHFPPLEALVYRDYLYSPTNRRWENLLGYNGLVSANFPELETIVDCVPLAAPGGDSAGIAPFNNSFTAYVRKMLQARLSPDGAGTQPIVAYGAPVWAWLEQAFPDAIEAQAKDGRLEPLSLIELNLFDNDVVTPVLCANHPCKYLYYTEDTDGPLLDEAREIMTQDIIAAGWQMRMAYHSNESSRAVLQELTDKWTDNPMVPKYMSQEDLAYGYKL